MLLPKTLLSICSVWLWCSVLSNALIVPQEIPSLLSLVYSNIPPIRKGTDSRLGFGFRLGEHADFQVVLELGPQKNTRPLGDKDSVNTFKKRQIGRAEENAILRNQLQRLQQQELTSAERNAANWLETWSQDINASNSIKTGKFKSQQSDNKKQAENTNSMPTVPVVPAPSLQQLQLLYKMATTTTAEPSKASKPLASSENMTNLNPRNIEERLKNKKQITKELMDVRLVDGD